MWQSRQLITTVHLLKINKYLLDELGGITIGNYNKLYNISEIDGDKESSLPPRNHR